MPNFFVFNNAGSPLFTQSTNTYTAPGVESLAESDAAKSGLLFTLASGISSVPSGQNLLVQVTNPGGSGKTMYISRIIGGITAAATLTIASGGTFTAAATPAPFNMNFGSATASSMTTKTANGTLGGSPVSFTAILAAAGQYTIGFGGGIVVPPGGVLTFSAGTGALNASANIMWWEF